LDFNLDYGSQSTVMTKKKISQAAKPAIARRKGHVTICYVNNNKLINPLG
jgi:hypothetical protein